ncbi:MAG: hypothetical protein ABW123_04925, partial [Cystobacter sp.]
GDTDAQERAPAKRPTRPAKAGKNKPGKARAELEQRLKQVVARFNVAQRGLLPPFEEALARLGSTEGFFLDAGTERAWFQGIFYSANYRLGLHYLDTLASAQVATTLTRALGQGSSPSGKEFQTWMSQLIASASGERVEAALMQSFTELTAFGAEPLLRVFEELQDTADWGDPALSTMARRMAARMDTRSAHRLFLARIARSALSDPALSEKLYRAALDATDSPDTAAWVAWLDRDTAKLEVLLDSPDPDLSGAARLGVLRHLLSLQKMETAALEQRLTALLARYGDEWAFTAGCAEMLAERQRPAQARALVEEWLRTHPKPANFDGINARTLIARLYQAEGDAKAGWKAVQPVLGSYKFTAMERGVLLSQALGDEKRARSLAEAASRRYPGPRSLSLLAEVLWRSGKYDDAAEALASPTRTVRAMDWREEVGSRFADVFASRPAREGLSAFTALQQKKVGPLELTQLAVSMKREGNTELAFELQSRVDAPGMQKLELLMDAYGYLQQWKSEKEAVEWLRTRVPPQLLGPLSMFAFQERADAVLWEVIPPPEGQGDAADYVWLMRAAARTRARERDERREVSLQRHFEVERAGFYHQLGRYLLGLIPEQAAIAAATTPKSREELPFFLGLKARADGRY